MTNPDLTALANELDDIETDAAGKCNWSEVATISAALRRLASSDGGVVKVRELDFIPAGDTDCYYAASTVFGTYWISEYPGAQKPFKLDTRQSITFHATLDAAKASAQADYEARIRSALVEVPAVKGEPEPVAWIDFADSGNVRLWTSEKSRAVAEIVSGRKMTPVYTAPPAGAGTREALEPFSKYKMTFVALSDVVSKSDLNDCTFVAGFTGKQPEFRHFDAARAALAAPGATTKSGGGVSLNDVREALERSIRELEYNRANHYSPDITTINRLKSQVLQAITKSDGGGESRPANPGTGGRAPCIEQTTPATMPAQAGVAPGPSDPSSTRSDVTVEELAHVHKAIHEKRNDQWNADARALLDQFEIRRK